MGGHRLADGDAGLRSGWLAISLDLGTVVGLTLAGEVLLLLPAVVEDLEDTESARDRDEGSDHHDEDHGSVEPCLAFAWIVKELVVVLVVLLIVAPIFLPVAGEDHDDEDDKEDGSDGGEGRTDVENPLADGDVVGLEEYEGEESDEADVETHGDPAVHDAVEDDTNYIEETNDKSSLSQGEKSAATAEVCHGYA